MPPTEAYIGLISGTSMDGIDAVLACFDPAPRLISCINHPWPEALLQQMREAAAGSPLTAAELARLDSAAGEVFAEAALAVMDGREGPVRAVGCHGQTLAHGPDQSPGFTLQIGNPALIAERTGVTTVADFRRRDIAAGGQGAPLVPAFHAAILRDPREDRIVLNIGGIANITVLPADPTAPVLGFDTGPGNCLLDTWVRRHTGQTYDDGGRFALTGTVRTDLLRHLLQDPYFALPAPKSTGTDYFSPAWLERHLSAHAYNAAEVQATLVALTAQTVADAIAAQASGCDRLLVCGGGVHNPAVMTALRERLPCTVESTASVDVEPDWVEAMAFAWLARQALEGRPGNLAAVTGAGGPRILGAIYPA